MVKRYDSEKIRKRALESADLILEGFTLRQISVKMKKSRYSIAYGIHHKLPSIDKEKYLLVKEKLYENSHLKHVRGTAEASRRAKERKERKKKVTK